jgi:hypothetical protein
MEIWSFNDAIVIVMWEMEIWSFNDVIVIVTGSELYMSLVFIVVLRFLSIYFGIVKRLWLFRKWVDSLYR